MELGELWNCIPKSEGKNNYKSEGKNKNNGKGKAKRWLGWGTRLIWGSWATIPHSPNCGADVGHLCFGTAPLKPKEGLNGPPACLGKLRSFFPWSLFPAIHAKAEKHGIAPAHHECVLSGR